MLLSTELTKNACRNLNYFKVNYFSTRASGCVVARTRPRTYILIIQTKCHFILGPTLIPSQTNISRTNKMVFSVACLQISELLRLIKLQSCG